VRFLIENGADLHFQDVDGDTPLHNASTRGHIDAAFILFLEEADLSVKNMNGKSPLDVAQNTNVVTVLLRWKKLVQDYPEVARHCFSRQATQFE
jgi:ankyrin repeat protein